MGVPESEQPPTFTTSAVDSESAPPSYSAVSTAEGNNSNPPTTSLLDVGSQQQQTSSPPPLEDNTAIPDEAPPSYQANLASEDANPDDLLQPVILVLAGQTIHAHKSGHVGPIPLMDPAQLASMMSSPSASSSSPNQTTVSPPLYQLSRGIASLGYETPSVEFQRLERTSKGKKQRPRHLYDLTLTFDLSLGWSGPEYAQMMKSSSGSLTRSGWRGGRGWRDGSGFRDCMFEMKSVSSRTVFGESGKRKDFGTGLRLWTASSAKYKATKMKKGDDTAGRSDVGKEQGMFEVGKLDDGRLEWRVESLFLPPGSGDEAQATAEQEDEGASKKKGWKERIFHHHSSSSSSTADNKTRHSTAVAFEVVEEGQPRLVVTAPLPRKIMDALVGVWCLRLWMNSADKVEKSVPTGDFVRRGFRHAAENGLNFGGPLGVGRLAG